MWQHINKSWTCWRWGCSFGSEFKNTYCWGKGPRATSPHQYCSSIHLHITSVPKDPVPFSDFHWQYVHTYIIGERHTHMHTLIHAHTNWVNKQKKQINKYLRIHSRRLAFSCSLISIYGFIFSKPLEYCWTEETM